MATAVRCIYINVTMERAMIHIDSVIGGRVSTIRLQSPDGKKCICANYEKYYFRMGASSVATVVFDDYQGCTRVSCTCAGSGNSLEFGANINFLNTILDSLKEYKIADVEK